jgi:soluble lytic murein transglycosylase
MSTYRRNFNRHFSRSAVMILLLVLLAACSPASSVEVTYIVITNTPAVTPTATFTPAPTPTPTPDIPPDVALRMSDRMLLDGYYEDAVNTFEMVLNRGDAAADQKAAAAFGQAQAALREGLFGEAVEALTFLIDNFPDDERSHQGYFLRGDAYLGLNLWTSAINDFRQYLRLRPGLIDSYAHERIGDAQLAINMLNDALVSYGLATDQTRSLVPQLALREKVAQVHLSSGRTAEAIAQYDAILQVSQNEPYRADIAYRAAEALINAGDLENGLTRMQRIFNDYPAQPQALLAMNTLLANERTLNSLQVGRVYYFREQYQEAIQAFNEYSTVTLLGDIPAELHLLLGRAYRAAGNSPAAQVAFQTLVQQYPTDPLLGEALLEQGRTRFLSGDINGAIEFYTSIANNYGYLQETAAEALWRVGYLYGTNEQPDASRETFLTLVERFPNSTQARSGLSIAAAAAAAAGDNATAEQLFNRLAQMSSGEAQAEALLQVGRLAQQRGDTAAANAAFQQAGASAPDTYFSARARDILSGTAPFTPPASFRFEFDEVAELQQAEDWLRSTFSIEQAGPLWPLSSTLQNDPRMVRGRELWAVGAFAEARVEFFDVLNEYRGDGLASYQLSVFLRGIASYFPSQQGAANVIQAAGISTLEAPSFIARLRYPIYYRDVVLRTAEQYGLDPLLIFSLIRHESLFDTNATAAAGEKGLTQVIPSTGEYIAGQLGWPNYQHADLFRPHAGVAFGAFYLDENMRRFDNNTYAALAAYNAGPGRAISWLNLSGGSDPDLFMNAITISSTRLYIQLIYRNYAIYRTLYGTG